MIAEERIIAFEKAGKLLHNGKRKDLEWINDMTYDNAELTGELCRGFNMLDEKMDVLQDSVSILIDRKPGLGVAGYWAVFTGSVSIVGIVAMICFH